MASFGRLLSALTFVMSGVFVALPGCALDEPEPDPGGKETDQAESSADIGADIGSEEDALGEAPRTDVTSMSADDLPDDSSIIPPAPAAPHCWACGNTQACYDSHSYNVCFATCSATGGQIWDLGLLNYGQCDPVSIDFCAWNNFGSTTMRCWGGYY